MSGTKVGKNQIGGIPSQMPKVTPTITAGAYTAEDAIGGLMTFTNAARDLNGSGIIFTVTISDKAKQDAEIHLFIFDQTFTATTDNNAFAPSDADMLNCLGVIKIEAADYSDTSNNSVATKSVVFPYKCAGDQRSLFAQAKIVSAGKSYTSTSDLQFTLGANRD